MDELEGLELLRGGSEGVAEWNRRRQSGEEYPNLGGVDLGGADLSGADLSGATLILTDLSGANLSEAKLRLAKLRAADFSRADLSGANLSRAELWDAHLSGADLRMANLSMADLTRAKLREANLSGADLSEADLFIANLSGADLSEANLRKAILRETNLSGANLSGAHCITTTFANVDLSEVKGLDSIHHDGPSTIGIDTLIRSKGKIPELFLRDCGAPESLIQSLPMILNSMEPIQFYSCFISHSSADKDFARRLFSRMRDEGIRAWLDEEDMKAGRELYPQIDEAIRVHNKFLLILSEASMHSNWVATEIRRTRLAEKREGQRKLFPIRLVDFGQIEAWELPDSSGEDLAEVVRKIFIPDFSNWKDHGTFEAAFARLLRDLKAEESTGISSPPVTPPKTPH